MRDKYQRHITCPRELDHDIHHRFLGGDIEAGRGFVCDEQLRSAGKGECDDDTLAHAAR